MNLTRAERVIYLIIAEAVEIELSKKELRELIYLKRKITYSATVIHHAVRELERKELIEIERSSGNKNLYMIGF